MPFSERIKFPNFIDNQKTIEERWTAQFGDKLNELVFIGHQLNEIEITKKLENCLCTTIEIDILLNTKMEDDFPVEKQFYEEMIN